MSESEIRVRVDDELLPLLGGSPEEIERHALEMIVVELYRRRTISAGRAAKFLHLEECAFMHVGERPEGLSRLSFE